MKKLVEQLSNLKIACYELENDSRRNVPFLILDFSKLKWHKSFVFEEKGISFRSRKKEKKLEAISLCVLIHMKPQFASLRLKHFTPKRVKCFGFVASDPDNEHRFLRVMAPLLLASVSSQCKK